MGCRCGVSDYPDTQKAGDDPKSRSWTSLSLLNPTSSQSQVAPPRFQPRGKAQGAAVEEGLERKAGVEAATLLPNGFPPITRITLPACHAQYPGGSDGRMRRLLPHPCGLPRFAGGSASASLFSRPAQASLALRPIGSLDRQKRPLSRGSGPSGHPSKTARQLPDQSTILQVEPSSSPRLRGALQNSL